MIRPERPADGSAGKLVVKARNLCQSFEGFLRIGQSVESGAAFGTVHFTVDVIRAGLSADVHNRAGIAAVFGAEIVRDDLVFVDKVCVGNEQTGSAN